MKILVVEDDPEVLALLCSHLEGLGRTVIPARDGAAALEQFAREEPDLIVLDIVLPRVDGWSVLREVRKHSRVPVIFLTSLDGTDEVVRGLSLGADDYLRKPLAFRELEARIEAVLRRSGGPVRGARISVGPIEVDDRAKTVTVEGRGASLTPREFELLKLFASDPGRVFSSDEILARLWSGSRRASSDDVKQYVHQLRRKLGDAARDRLETVRGFGYRLAP